MSAYNLKTGEPVWRHSDAARFWESNAGPGPRATPTLSNGHVYTHGATGILNALDARDGSVIWSRNTASDTSTKVPDWGIASSPLVVGDVVIAAAAGSLAAYDRATGKPRWFGPKGGGWAYSSPQVATIDGVTQIVFVNGPGVIGVSPSDGALLWKHEWGGDSIVQPAVLAGGDLLIGSGSGLAANTGMLRVNVAREPGGWMVKERWTSTGTESVFQRLRRPPGPRLRFRRQHPRVHRSPGRHAQVEGWTLRPRPADSVGRPERSARTVGRRRAGACFCDRRQIYGDREGLRRSRAKPGTIPCWPATSSWCATAKRWPRSGCPSRAQASDISMPESFASTRKKNPSVSPCWATQLTIFSANASAFSSSFRPGIRS